MSEDFPAPLAGLQAGSLMAGYRLEKQIGAGGMAVVFRARDERLGRLVALKVLAPALVSDPGFRRRFIAESRAAAAVDDPHIIPIYEAGEADGALFIAMRFVQGGDLRRVLDREGALSPGRAAGFISPVASALDAAHGAGLVHRDVKPANILVDTRRDRPDHVYLSDFGVSKGAVSSASLTGAGHFLGTPDYSAPEQIQGLAVDGRADQYALACVTYQLLTGVVPFERDQGMAVLFAHLSEPPPSLGSRRPGLPAVAERVLAKGLAKVPEQRFGSCADFADALREALGLAPYAAPTATTAQAAASDRPPASIITPSQVPRRAVTGTTGSVASGTGTRSRPVPAPVDEAVIVGWLGNDQARFPATSGQQTPPSAPAGTLAPAGPPVPGGLGRGRGRSPSSRSPWPRRLAPVAAAAAIVAIIVTVLMTAGNPKPRAGATGGPTPGTSAPKAGPTPVTSAVGSRSHPTPDSSASGTVRPTTSASNISAGLTYALGGRVPPYYVWLNDPGNAPSEATVRMTATGAVLATIKAAAADGTIASVTGAADDRTFVLDEQPFVYNIPGADQTRQPRTFYLLHLSTDGQPASVTKLPISEPSGAAVNGVALSPDGTELAVAVSPNNVESEPELTELKLYSVATGAVLRTWDADGGIGFSLDDPEALSWTSDQQTLGFTWVGHGLSPQQGEWLLDLSLSGSNLLSNSHQVTSLGNTAGTPHSQSTLTCDEDIIVAPNGSSLICGAVAQIGSPNGGDTVETAYFEYSPSSGKVIKNLAQSTLPNAGLWTVDVLWSNPSGSVLVGEIPTTGNGAVVMVTASGFTPLPGLRSAAVAIVDQGAW